MPSYLRVRTEAASHEDFGDEVVVIHNESGVFYSLTGRSIAVWRALMDGVEQAGMECALEALAEDEAMILRAMVQELSAAGIVVTADAGSLQTLDLAAADLGPARFESNSDFDDLIRLDPIHDVTDAGWPHRKDDAS